MTNTDSLVAWWLRGKDTEFVIERLWVWLPAGLLRSNNSKQVVHTYVPLCKWYSMGSATFRFWFESHQVSFASNHEQVANLLYTQVNSASYPEHLDWKWSVAYGLQGELKAYCGWMHYGPNSSPAWATDGRMMCCGIISSYESAATFGIVKHF